MHWVGEEGGGAGVMGLEAPGSARGTSGIGQCAGGLAEGNQPRAVPGGLAEGNQPRAVPGGISVGVWPRAVPGALHKYGGPGFHWRALAVENVSDRLAEGPLVSQVADVAIVGPDCLIGIGQAGGAEGSRAGGLELSEDAVGIVSGCHNEMDVSFPDVQGVELPGSLLTVLSNCFEKQLAAGLGEMEGSGFGVGSAPAVQVLACRGGGVEGVAAPGE